MKRILLIFLMSLTSFSLFLFSQQERFLLSPSGIEIKLNLKQNTPGGMIKISIEDREKVESCAISFLGRKYFMGKDSGLGNFISLIGLDLALKEGSYPIEIFLKPSGRNWEHISTEIQVGERLFPEKRLWVEERFVTPPPEVQERIEMEAAMLRTIFLIFSPSWLGEGEFILPCKGKLVENFGERRIFNNKPRSPHSGVDITAPVGTVVLASNSGKVVLSSELYFAGKTVIIDHGLGLFTLYCHFSRLRVRRGDLVKKGEVIGEVGATGRVTGAHLHWGARVLESRIDPVLLLEFFKD